ncbi:hypothetical protein HQ560_17485, partial [bacterium]|nr:hypothetical protein [bacterium]
YAAVVVEGMTRPEDFGLNLAAAAAAVEAYAAKGGRFIVLAPQCKATLFGVENADWGGWHQDAVREVYPGHPLLAARTREQTLAGWPGHESVGYWIRERDSAFQPLLVDWRDIHRYVVTLARQVGTGYIILDTQPLGQAPNADAATWKLHAYLGQQPVLRRVEVANDTEGGGLGAGERLTLQTRPTPYIIEVANRLPSASLRPMSLEFAMAAPDRPLEPDDTPATAKVADAGQTLQATLDPGGDADWRAVTAPERGVLSLRVTDLADNVDPVLAVRRPPSADKALRVLYLEGDPKNAIDEDRFAGVAITRIDAFEPRAAKALDLLAEHDMAILSSLSDARQFGLAQPASHEKLRRFVEAGGRCVVLRPFGLSFAENNPQMGGRFLGASSQWDAGVWHGAHASDGYKVPGARGYTWCCGNGAKFPHTLTWALAPTARRIDRLVLYSHTTTAKARPKKIEVRVGADPKALKSVGTFVAADSDARQVFRFPPVDCSVAQLVITENYGHTKETQLGEVEFYGPDSMVGFFGVPFEAGPRGNTTVVADPMHWLLRRRAGGRLSGWGAAENAGYWSGWREKGFHLVCADRADVRRYGATLFRRLGKGSVVLDAQSLAHAPFAPHAAWRLHNLFDAGSDVMGRFDATQAQTHGADETVDLPLTEKSSLLVGVEDNAATGNVSNRSARAYRFTAAFRPEGSEVEPNDLPARAVRLMLGEAVEDALFPGGDVDWYTVAVERPATVSVRVDGVPANLDPVVEVHRADLRGKPVKALLLACQPDTNIDRRIWGPAPVTFTRIDAGTPAEATALENLGAYDVVLLDRPDTARRFGLDRKENWAAIEKYAEGGGRFIVLGPRGASFSLLGGGAGARATAWSAGVGGLDDAYRLCDGVWHPNSTGGAWASRYKAKPPHWVVFRLAGAKPVPIDRMVLCVSASTPARCAKDIELQVAQDDDATTFTSVGKWTCPAEGGRQTLRFDATTARLVKFIVHANHGDPNYTNIGNIELYGPGQPEGLFGVPHIDSGVDSIAPAGETHWITARKPEKQSWGRLGTRGYFVAWDGSGFEPVLVDKAAAGKRAVTLCKTVGKGAIVLDAQDLGAPGRDRDAAWKLQTYLGVAPTLVAEFNNTLGMGKGGGEHFAFDAAPALYYLRLGDWQVERQRARGTLDPSPGAPWSLNKLRLLVTLGESDRPFEPNDTPERATALASGLPVKSTLFPAG